MTPLSRNPAVQELLRFFAENGLGVPPIPPELATSVRKLRDRQWSSRELGWPPRASDRYVEELVRSPPGDHVAVAYDGQGAAAWGIHYQLVRGRLALLLHVAWGGGYPAAGESGRVAAVMAAATRLIKAAEIAERNGRWPGNERLLAINSFDVSWWATLTGEEVWCDWEFGMPAPARCGGEVRFGGPGALEVLEEANAWIIGRW